MEQINKKVGGMLVVAQQAVAAELVVRQSGRIGAGVNNKYNWTI